MSNDVLLLEELPLNAVTDRRWIDNARLSSTLNKSANVIGVGADYEFEYLLAPKTGSKYKLGNDCLFQYLDDLKDAHTLLDIWKVYGKYLVDDETLADAGLGLSNRDNKITNFINFILEYYYRTKIKIDSFSDDGGELAEFLSTQKLIDPNFLRNVVYNMINIMAIDDTTCEQGEYREITYISHVPSLYLNKLFTKEYPSLNKLAVSNFLRNKSYIVFKDKDNDLYNDIVKAFSTLNEVPKVAKLYIGLDDYPKDEYLLLIKDDCIQIF